jgi:hypothetical protein
METSFDKIKGEYRLAKAGRSNIGLLSLKSEIESYIKNQERARREDDDSLIEAQDMLMDVTQMLEEDRCNPFRPKTL